MKGYILTYDFILMVDEKKHEISVGGKYTLLNGDWFLCYESIRFMGELIVNSFNYNFEIFEVEFTKDDKFYEIEVVKLIEKIDYNKISCENIIFDEHGSLVYLDVARNNGCGYFNSIYNIKYDDKKRVSEIFNRRGSEIKIKKYTYDKIMVEETVIDVENQTIGKSVEYN